eukprot:3117607-Prymnesium_polylepis.1
MGVCGLRVDGTWHAGHGRGTGTRSGTRNTNRDTARGHTRGRVHTNQAPGPSTHGSRQSTGLALVCVCVLRVYGAADPDGADANRARGCAPPRGPAPSQGCYQELPVN